MTPRSALANTQVRKGTASQKATVTLHFFDVTLTSCVFFFARIQVDFPCRLLLSEKLTASSHFLWNLAWYEDLYQEAPINYLKCIPADELPLHTLNIYILNI